MTSYQIIRRSEQLIEESLSTIELLGKSEFYGYEIVRIYLSKEMPMPLPKKRHQESLKSLLMVNSGALIDTQTGEAIEVGDCLTTDDLEAYGHLKARTECEIVFIFSTMASEPSMVNDLGIIKTISTGIQNGRVFEASDQEYFSKLLKIQTAGFFCGETYDQVYEVFLTLFNSIPLSPLKLRPSYISRLCTLWVLSTDDLEGAFFRCVQFISKLYKGFFMPHVHNKLVREAVYWTLIDNDELKSVQYLSKKLFVNRTHLSERFIELTGQSASDYILSVKMYGAMIMLLNPKVSLNDVLVKLQYHDVGHFSRNFKKYSGMTPQAFKQYYNFME